MLKDAYLEVLENFRKYYAICNDGRQYAYLKAYNEVSNWYTINSRSMFNRELNELTKVQWNELDKKFLDMAQEHKVSHIGPAIFGKLNSVYSDTEISNYDTVLKTVSDISSNPHKHYMSRYDARDLIEPIISCIRRNNLKYFICGSYRRESYLVGDLDLIIDGGNLIGINEELHRLRYSEDYLIEFLAEGDYKSKIEFTDMATGKCIEVDIRAVEARYLGSMLLYFTGPKSSNVRLRGIAKSLGYKLNEYGIVTQDGVNHEFRSERDIYKFLGLDYVKPSKRL